MSSPLTYWDYIKLDVIHDLQTNVQTDHYDEVMFIAIHQHFELWFAQVMRNLDEVIRRLTNDPPDIRAGTALMIRVNCEFALATQGFEVMKTLARESFLAFRGALQGTSGLQSAQLTIIELLTGRREDEMYHEKISGSGMEEFMSKYYGPQGVLPRIARERLHKGTLRSAYDHVTAQPGIAPEDVRALQQQLVHFDEQLAGWRPKHYEAAATVLGRDFTETAGTVGNHQSCHENLTTAMSLTHRYFEDVAAQLKSQD
ncbi:MAG: hypothetical protein K1Y36_11705 [Blastocatellia bacterium]|nr:hypothetical protein [Blastocatellia bacterium]